MVNEKAVGGSLLRAVVGLLGMIVGAWIAWGAGAAIFVCGLVALVVSLAEAFESVDPKEGS